jgi:hypothetical protein
LLAFTATSQLSQNRTPALRLPIPFSRSVIRVHLAVPGPSQLGPSQLRATRSHRLPELGVLTSMMLTSAFVTRPLPLAWSTLWYR